jgi:hypothetical protein
MGKPKFWLEATRHEDKLQLGIADVSYVSRQRQHGWIELKKLAEWPKRESTIVRIDHYTSEQRIWLKDKGKVGGFTFLFLQVGRDYMLFDWQQAQQVGQVPKGDLVAGCRKYWQKRIDWDQLGWYLCER